MELTDWSSDSITLSSVVSLLSVLEQGGHQLVDTNHIIRCTMSCLIKNIKNA